MYLKERRYPYRRRSSLWRSLVILVLIFIGGYFIYQNWAVETGPLLLMSTPTPIPTPTRSAISYTADGDDLYWTGRLSQAIQAYAQSLDMEPDQPELYVKLARILIFRGRPERGLEMARAALRFNPDSAPAWAVLGMAYDWLGLPDEAIPACEQAIRLDPTYPEAYAYLAEAYIDAGRWYDANDVIDTAMELNANNVDVLRDYGYVLEMQGNYTGAIQAYRDALQHHAYLAHLYLAIGRNAQALGNYTLAQESYQSAIEADPQSAAAQDQLGWSYLLEGDYGPAEAQFEAALAADPSYYQAYGHLGTLYFQRRNYEEAIPAYQDAVRYADAEVRRHVVFFVVTLEPSGGVGDEPAGPEVLRAEFVHPQDPEGPLRGLAQGSEDYATVAGSVRLDVMGGRYTLRLQGLPPAPAGQDYYGWFVPLQSSERLNVRTEALAPLSDGSLELIGVTGPVRSAPIEHYYTLAFCYYYLDQCNEARPYIDIALRIDPEDVNALEMRRLCTP